jgi:endonuclease YncB( thermonuclease family)
MRLKNLFSVALLLLPLSVYADFTARVVGVHDGDTITALDESNTQHKCRLGLIDAPELSQDFGQRSKQSLSDLVFGKTVRISSSEVDQYKRNVCVIFVGNTDVNLEQVKRGMAWVYQQYAKRSPNYGTYLAAETQAKAARLGLWQGANPQPPWEFRHGSKSHSASSGTESFFSMITGNKQVSPAAPAVDCGTKHLCSQMTSCEEAKHYLNDCHVTSLDRDHDGIPCQKLCQ